MIFEHGTGGGAKHLAMSKKEVPSVVQTRAPVPCSQNINKTKGRGHTLPPHSYGRCRHRPCHCRHGSQWL